MSDGQLSQIIGLAENVAHCTRIDGNACLDPVQNEDSKAIVSEKTGDKIQQLLYYARCAVNVL